MKNKKNGMKEKEMPKFEQMPHMMDMKGMEKMMKQKMGKKGMK